MCTPATQWVEKACPPHDNFEIYFLVCANLSYEKSRTKLKLNLNMVDAGREGEQQHKPETFFPKCITTAVHNRKKLWCYFYPIFLVFKCPLAGLENLCIIRKLFFRLFPTVADIKCWNYGSIGDRNESHQQKFIILASCYSCVRPR